MKKSYRLAFAFLAVSLLAATAAAQETEKAYIVGAGATAYVQVETGALVPEEQPVVGLYKTEEVGDEELSVFVTDQVSDVSADRRRFRINFPPGKSFDPKVSYEVLVSLVIKVGEPGVRRTVLRRLPVRTTLSAAVTRPGPPCQNGVVVRVTNNLDPDQFDWNKFYEWLDSFQKPGARPGDIATLRIRLVGGGNPELLESWTEYEIRGITYVRPKDPRLTSRQFCLLPEDRLPESEFVAKVKFKGAGRPDEIKEELTSKKLAGVTLPTVKGLRDDIESPADRALERNVDVGFTLSSSVADEEVPATATEPATVVRGRTTRGVWDVRFAPWLDVLHPHIRDNEWMHFLTPLYVNANVATGKIEEDTLSLNRVLLGFEGEFRRRHVDDTQWPGGEPRQLKIATHRVVYGLTHASDRDFKQKEFTGKIEYKPIIWRLNNPVNLNYHVEHGERKYGTFGYSFLPLVGFEIGKTYSRRDPAPAVEPSDTVRRLYFGLDMSLDVTRRLTFAVSDTFYFRGETPDDRGRNYFKAEAQAPLGRLYRASVHGLYFSYERGDKPPFATPGVNAIKLGYRVQANFCAPNCR